MKKIIIIFLLLIFNTPISLAQEETAQSQISENIETVEVEPVVAESENEEIDNIFTNDPQSNIALQGYLEYTDVQEDSILLEDDSYKNSLNLKAPPRINAASLIPSKLKQSPHLVDRRLETASKFSDLEYSIAPISSSFEGKAGKFSMGTMYNSSLSGAQLSYATGMFAKYNGKYVALTTAFSKNTKSTFDAYSDKVYFAPELKLTKKFSIVNISQFDVMQPRSQSKVVLRYKPTFNGFADDVQFELGAGQSFAENKPINSSVEFSTKFKL